MHCIMQTTAADYIHRYMCSTVYGMQLQITYLYTFYHANYGCRLHRYICIVPRVVSRRWIMCHFTGISVSYSIIYFP